MIRNLKQSSEGSCGSFFSISMSNAHPLHPTLQLRNFVGLCMHLLKSLCQLPSPTKQDQQSASLILSVLLSIVDLHKWLDTHKGKDDESVSNVEFYYSVFVKLLLDKNEFFKSIREVYFSLWTSNRILQDSKLTTAVLSLPLRILQSSTSCKSDVLSRLPELCIKHLLSLPLSTDLLSPSLLEIFSRNEMLLGSECISHCRNLISSRFFTKELSRMSLNPLFSKRSTIAWFLANLIQLGHGLMWPSKLSVNHTVSFILLSFIYLFLFLF